MPWLIEGLAVAVVGLAALSTWGMSLLASALVNQASEEMARLRGDRE